MIGRPISRLLTEAIQEQKYRDLRTLFEEVGGPPLLNAIRKSREDEVFRLTPDIAFIQEDL